MAYHLVEEKPLTITLPCAVGSTVYCNVDGHEADYLDECIIGHIEFDKDWPEPLFTALCYSRGEYQTFWLSDFGKLVITEATYINMEPDEMARFIKKARGSK